MHLTIILKLSVKKTSRAHCHQRSDNHTEDEPSAYVFKTFVFKLHVKCDAIFCSWPLNGRYGRTHTHNSWKVDMVNNASDMSEISDVSEFKDLLIKVSAAEKMKTALFKNKYYIFLNENWKPWPHVPEDLFKRSFIVCSSEDNRKQASVHFTGGISEYSRTFSERESVYYSPTCEFTGCPLEYGFEITDLHCFEKPGEHHKYLSHLQNPLNFVDARYVCFLYAKIQSSPDVNESVKNIPMFIFCDGKDLSHIVLMGTGKNKRSSVRDIGDVTKNRLPNMTDLKKKHLQGFPLSFSEIETNVYWQYDIIRTCSEICKAEHIKPATQGIVSLECSSSSFGSALKKPPTDAACLLLIQAVAGNENEGAHNRFKELQFIKMLCESLRSGEMLWPQKKVKTSVLDKLQSFLDSLKRSRTTYKIKEQKLNEATDFDSEFLRYMTGERDDMDFTDHLWNILKDCASYGELVTAFSLCFSELKDFSFMPYLYRTNMTTIGQVIRNKGTEHLLTLSLDGTKPLKLLLELGVEKLLKDYVMLFVGLEMVPYDFLIPYLNENKLFGNASENFTLVECMERTVKCLEKFHTVEELLIIFWTFFRSSKAELNGFVRMVLKHYATVSDVDPSHIFKFSISLCSVKHIVGKFKPVIWQVSFKSQCENYEKQSILRIYKKEIPTDKLVPKAGMPLKPTFYGTEAIFISDSDF